MRTTKAFLASLGTSALLVASSVTMLAVFSALVAFSEFPGAAAGPERSAMVVRLPDTKIAAVKLSEADAEAADAAEAAEDSASEPASDLGQGANTGFDPGGTPSQPPDFPGPGPNPPDPGPGPPEPPGGSDGPIPPIDPPGEALDGVPGLLNDTVNHIDLGRTGRNVTTKLADGLVHQLDPNTAESLKEGVDPLWQVVDRDR